MSIIKATKGSDGEVWVTGFRNGYYMHSIHKEGSPDDAPGIHSMWGWVNHMREKNWWSRDLEDEFINAVRAAL